MQQPFFNKNKNPWHPRQFIKFISLNPKMQIVKVSLRPMENQSTWNSFNFFNPFQRWDKWRGNKTIKSDSDRGFSIGI